MALIFAHILGLALENGVLRLFCRSAGIESGDISPHSTILPVLEQAAFLLAPAWEQGGLWSAAKRRRFGSPAERGDRPNAPFSTAPPQQVGKDQGMAPRHGHPRVPPSSLLSSSNLTRGGKAQQSPTTRTTTSTRGCELGPLLWPGVVLVAPDWCCTADFGWYNAGR
jgi:hypothetical protein